MREERKEEEEEEERARDMHGFLYPRRKLNRRTPILNLLQREKKKKEKKKKCRHCSNGIIICNSSRESGKLAYKGRKAAVKPLEKYRECGEP